MKAIWMQTLLAESDDTVVVEGNHYFPTQSLVRRYLEPSTTQTHCHWKGTAHYYHLNVEGACNPDAAWYYPEPKTAAKHIQGRIAFWRGVQVVE